MRRFAAASLLAALALTAALAFGAATTEAAPGAVGGLVVPPYSTGGFTSSWDPVAGIAGYACSLDRDQSATAGTAVALPATGFSSSQITVGSGARQVVTGDFGNGQIDLAVLNENADTVRILLGDGHGAFAKGGTYATGNDPHSIAVGDFNGDGRPDLAVADWADDAVSVLLATGVGTFAPKVDYPTGNEPHGLAVADLGNGHLDLVVANAADNTISVLLGKGDGTFATGASYRAGAHPEKVVVGDYNGDGRPDLAVINNVGNTVMIYRGNGDGTLTPGNTYPTGRTPYWMTAGDLGNGELDLAVANFKDNTVSVLLGHGDGTFAARVNYATDINPICVAITDVNGDGIPDLVVSDRGANNLAVLLGRGDATFAAAQFIATAGPTPRFFAVGDFNGDGSPDLAVPFDTTSRIAVMPNTTGSTRPEVQVPAPAEGAWYVHVCAVDTAGDAGPTSTGEVVVDTTPPVTTDDANPGGVATWHAGPWDLTLSASDPPAPDGSASGMSGGAAATQYSTDGGATWQAGTQVAFARWKRGGGTGSYGVLYRSSDAAGNLEPIRQTTVWIDNTYPTCSAAVNAAGDPATVTFAAADSYSGVAAVWYALDDGPWSELPWPAAGAATLQVAGPGAHTVRYYAVDNAGNRQVGYQVIGLTVPDDSAGPPDVPAATPLDSVPPAIQGAATVGKALACSTGIWASVSPITYSYQWLRDGAAISGATGSSYVVANADLLHLLSCTVTADNAAGSASATAGRVSIVPRLTLRASVTRLKIGSRLVLSGTVVNAKVGCRTVTVARVTSRGRTTLRTVALSSTGAFSMTYRPPTTGSWIFVACYKPGTTTIYRSNTVRARAHA